MRLVLIQILSVIISKTFVLKSQKTPKLTDFSGMNLIMHILNLMHPLQAVQEMIGLAVVLNV